MAALAHWAVPPVVPLAPRRLGPGHHSHCARPAGGAVPKSSSRVPGARRLALLLWLSGSTLRCLTKLLLWPREMALDLQGSSILDILLGRFSTCSMTLRRTQRLAQLRELRIASGGEVNFGLNPFLLALCPVLLPVALLWKPLPTFYLLLVFYLFYREKTNAPEPDVSLRSRSPRSSEVTFVASATAQDLWKCRLWRSWLNQGLNDIMTYSIAGLVAELGDLRRATTFELANLELADGALVMDAVAQLPENALFKYRLRTGLLLGDVDGSQCIIWDDPGIQVKPMLFPEFWAPIGGFAGRRLPTALRLDRLEVQEGGILEVSGRLRRGEDSAIVRRSPRP